MPGTASAVPYSPVRPVPLVPPFRCPTGRSAARTPPSPVVGTVPPARRDTGHPRGPVPCGTPPAAAGAAGKPRMGCSLRTRHCRCGRVRPPCPALPTRCPALPCRGLPCPTARIRTLLVAGGPASVAARHRVACHTVGTVRMLLAGRARATSSAAPALVPPSSVFAASGIAADQATPGG